MKAIKACYEKNIAHNQHLSMLSCFFLPFAWIYGIGSAVHRWLFDQGIFPRQRLPVKVISIGNLVVGGTGKTPAVIALTLILLEMKKTPVILTRGYGSDEAALLQHRLEKVKVLAGKNRGEQALSFLENGGKADVFVLDDGFQHWPLERDRDIVLINAANPFGNGRLLPAGILRETSPALSRAHLVILTHCDEISPMACDAIETSLREGMPHLAVIRSRHKPELFRNAKTGEALSPEAFHGREVMAFCGIAYPEGFRHQLECLGIKLAGFVAFGDHAPYGEREERKLQKLAQENPNACLVTTEKDFYRNKTLFEANPKCWVMTMKLDWVKGEKFLHEQLHSVFSR